MFIKKEDCVLASRILKFYKPYSAKIAWLFVCIIVSTGINLLIPYIAKLLMDKGLISMNYGYTLKLVFLNVLLMLIAQLVFVTETKYMVYINAMASFSMNKAALKKLLGIKLQYFDSTNFSMIINNINTDIENISKICDDSSLYGIAQILGFVGGLIGLVLIDWRLAIVVFATLPAKYLIIRYMSRIRREYTKEEIKIYGDYSSWYGDIIGGIREIRLWGRGAKIRSNFVRKQRKMINISIKLALLNSLNNASEAVLYHILVNALYIMGGYFVIGKTMSIGALFAVISYSTYVTRPVNVLLNIWYNFSGFLPSAKRFFEFLDLENEGEVLNKESVDMRKKAKNGDIKFEKVSFSYEKGNKILDNISLEIKNGECVAIIGPNGAGKSTIINLLLRMYQPDSGKIFVGGADINGIRIKEYREMVSVVNQDTYLFNTTIRENIALFADEDFTRVYKAAQAVCAHDFIDRMPDKYESIVGRNGAKLSGGQRQKIAIARAFFKDSAILVLDEATSNCDTVSEMQINTMIKDNYSNKTIIMVTHKFSILKNADRIFLLENGSIKEIGTYKDLLSTMDIYKNIFEHQEILKTV